MTSVLIIDDDQSIAKNLEYALKVKNIETFSAFTGKDGLTKVENHRPDIIFLDYHLPDTDGLIMIPKILELHSKAIIIMITGVAHVDVAVKAIKAGAYDFVEKPFEIDKVFAILKKTEKERINQEKVQHLEETIKRGHDTFVGQSKSIQDLKKLIKKIVVNPNFTILISGESGTGKEVLVRYLHSQSLYAAKPLIDVNCSAIPETLLESELFGYEKGAFTDAQNTKPGLFELAQDGIIFLDEIGDMKLDLQTKLLRVLENREIRHIGGDLNISLNVAVVAATNRDLKAMVKAGTFREDLYYRLNIIPLHLPPLKEHSEDIPELIQYFIEKFNQMFRKNISGISAEALAILKRYPFPGNVRELRNIIELAMLIEATNILQKDSFAHLNTKPEKEEVAPVSYKEYSYAQFKKNILLVQEKKYFEELLELNKGNVGHAAKHAGIMVQSLSRILRRHKISKDTFKQ
jgi:DNA-binding NtrC family response regulator